MRPKLRVYQVKAVCAPPALCIPFTTCLNRRPCSFLKPLPATCKWSAMRCEISTGRPDASFRPFPFAVRRFESLQLYLCVCLCVCVYIWVSVCMCLSTDACCLNTGRLTMLFRSPPDGQTYGPLSLASPSEAVLFSAMLDSARPGLAAQVLQNWSNYPVLCHPADELITASACFPLNLESQ